MKFGGEYKNNFRILKGGKISLVVSALLVSAATVQDVKAAALGTLTVSAPRGGGIQLHSASSSYVTNIGDAYQSIHVTPTGSVDADNDFCVVSNDGLESSNFVLNEGNLTVRNTVYGPSVGIEIQAGSTAAGSQITNSGLIDIRNDDRGYAIRLGGKNYGDINNSYGSTILISNMTHKCQAVGLSNDNAGTISNSGSIRMISANNTFDHHAIIAPENSGSILNSNSIFIDSNQTACGIEIEDYAGNTGNISNSGSIEITSNRFATGVEAYKNSGTIRNSGVIETRSNGADDATGIVAGYNDNNVSNSGTIRSTGPFAYGIESWINYMAIENSGVIDINGMTSPGTKAYLFGIYAENYTYNSSVVNRGSITIALADNPAGRVYATAAGIGSYVNSGTIANANTITIEANPSFPPGSGNKRSSGIYSRDNYGDINNSATLDINATYYAGGVVAANNHGSLTSSGTMRVNASMTPAGFFSLSNTGSMNNTGNIDAKGQFNALGMMAQRNNGTITNSGTINTDNTVNDAYTTYGSIGIYAGIPFAPSSGLSPLLRNGTTPTVTNSGTVTATFNAQQDCHAYSIITTSQSVENTVSGKLYGNLNIKQGTINNAGLMVLPTNAFDTCKAYAYHFNNLASGTLQIGLNTNGTDKTFTELEVNAATFANGSTIHVDVGSSTNLVNLVGTTLNNIVYKATAPAAALLREAPGIAIDPAQINVTDNSPDVNFEAEVDSSGNIDLRIVSAIIPEPEINIKGNNNPIGTGDTTPESTDGTDFGDADIDTGSVTHTFVIENTGDADLLLDGNPAVSMSGDIADFSYTNLSATTVPASDSVNLVVTFDPASVGSKIVTISIDNNDADEDPYTFTLQGNATGDTDGSSEEIEDNVPGVNGSSTGDGNGDTIPDSQQSYATSNTFNNGGTTSYFTLATSQESGQTSNANVVQNSTPAHPIPNTMNMPYGTFEFEVNGVTPGADVTIELFVPYNADINGYAKWNNTTNQWEELNGVSIEHFPDDDKTKITFSVQEGGDFDGDDTPNGTLVDPGGPIVKAAATVAVPLFGPLGTLLLSVLMGFFGYRRLKD